MRIRRFTCASLVILVAAVVAAASGRATAAGGVSLAQSISYDGAELWQNAAGTPAVLPPGGYTATGELLPVVDAPNQPCADCNEGDGSGICGAYPYNRCGCSSGLFPWFSGPGSCDTWCVGPHWEVALDGLIMQREGANWAAVPVAAGFTTDLIDDFDVGPGARLFVTGYNDSNFGLQVGYEGINDFHSTALFSTVAGDRRSIAYESNFNSVEINFIRRTESRWRPFAGVRYLELDDDFVDTNVAARVIPPPATPPAAPAAFIDLQSSFLLDNRLIGLQGGVFRDVWRLNRWVTLEPFGNAGVYLNDLRRVTRVRQATTIITGDDLSTAANEFSVTTSEISAVTKQEIEELAFMGEAGVTAVFRLNRCVALRAGYQVLAIDRIGQGLDAFLAPGLTPSTLVYHGGHFGVEYVR